MQMIPVVEIPDNAFLKADQVKPPVTRHDETTYEVLCRKKHRHFCYFEWLDDLQLLVGCNPRTCPSRVGCYHRAAAYIHFEFDHLETGRQVLVSEASGLRWHTFLRRDARHIYTRELPDGFPSIFVVDFECLILHEGRACLQ
ncbi:MAG: hypothetical protein WCB68_17935 [Pyrinomonadaceae bacterium]